MAGFVISARLTRLDEVVDPLPGQSSGGRFRRDEQDSMVGIQRALLPIDTFEGVKGRKAEHH